MIFKSIYAQNRNPIITGGCNIAISAVESLLLFEKSVTIEYLYLRI
jgi:hypothetical protein